MFNVNYDIGIVVAVVAIAILVLVLIAIMLITGRSREELKALGEISDQLKDVSKDVNRQPAQTAPSVQYIPVVVPQAAPVQQAPSAPAAAPPAEEAAKRADAETIIKDREEKTEEIDPLEEILRFGFLKEEPREAVKEDNSNLGKSGKRYSKEELEALIKN